VVSSLCFNDISAVSQKIAHRVGLVGQRIRQLRKSRNLTQNELSEKIGVAQSDLSRMEKGEYKVGLDTLFRILQVFELNMSDFFDEASPLEQDRDAWREFQMLPEDTRREVRDFIRFKRSQTADGNGEEGEAASEPDHSDLGLKGKDG
jgi:transcriptional regulator with XRE-family HTH domain